ncbi:hypothetical protein RI367_000476 [Sorochytrium milnesiophthora]
MPRNAHTILLYGANGYTAKLAAEFAVSNNEHAAFFKSTLVLAGRSKEKVEPIAKQYNLPFRTFSLTDSDTATIDEALKDVRVVMHLAGPFMYTAEPMIKACIRNKCDYLDITGEQDVFQMVFEKHSAEITRAGIIAIPGAGFDVVPTDCVAARLAQALPSATHLDLAFGASKGSAMGPSAGTAATAFAAVTGEAKACARRDGKMVPERIGYKQRTAKFATSGETNVMWMPWGDCYTAHHSTKIPNINTFIITPYAAGLVAYYGEPLFKFALRYVPFLKRTVESAIPKFITGPTKETREKASVDVWGEARDERTGDVATLSIVVKEGYTLTALTALETALRLYERKTDMSSGPATPSMAFGASFVDMVTLHSAEVVFDKASPAALKQ